MAHVHTFTDISDPRTAAHVDLVAYGETPRVAEVMLAAAEDNPGRTISGQFAAVAYDDEPYRGKRTPYCAVGIPL